MIEGIQYERIPRRGHGSLLNIAINETTELKVERLAHGLHISSHSARACRVGLLNTHASALLDELELPPLGSGELKYQEKVIQPVIQTQESDQS